MLIASYLMTWCVAPNALLNATLVTSPCHVPLAVGSPSGSSFALPFKSCALPCGAAVRLPHSRPLKHADMANWLYAGGNNCHPCSSQQVILILVAGLMPEELKDEAAAAQLAAVQGALLGRLADMYPAALFYSNFFRWGMLHEWDELQELVAAAEAGRTGEGLAGCTLAHKEMACWLPNTCCMTQAEGHSAEQTSQSSTERPACACSYR